MTLHIAILGILSSGNHHPYDIKKMLLSRNMGDIPHFNDGSLYYNFEVLRKKQYIEKLEVTRDVNRPSKTTYGITTLGREALEQEIYSSLKNFTTIRGIYATTCFIRYADQSKVGFLVEEIIQKQRERLKHAQDIVNSVEEDTEETAYLIYDHAYNQIKLELEWLAKLLANVREHEQELAIGKS